MRRLKSMPKAGSCCVRQYPCMPASRTAQIVSQRSFPVTPIGVDLESMRRERDLGTAAALLGLAGGGSSDSAVLRAWVTAEARLKAGPDASPQVWLSTWEACQLAVAGSPSPPLAGVFDGMAGIYNPTALQWEAV